MDFEDHHPHRDRQTVTPQYLRFLLLLQTERLQEMIDAKFQALLDEVAALFTAASGSDATDVAAARKEDIDALQGLVDKLKATLSPPVVVTVTATSISGPVGTAISGQLEATGGAEPYVFSGSGSTVVVAGDGSYSTPATEVESDTLTVTATDANGVPSAPLNVPVSIA